MAVKAAQVTAKVREELGSRANKRLRDAGLLPGVVYGHKEAVVPVTLTRKEVAGHLNHGAHVFDLMMGDKTEKVLLKEIQYDHLGTNLMHVDFARVSLDEKVKVTVSLELKGTPKGSEDGGVLTQVIKELHVECLVTEIPEIIRYNVSEMALNDVLHLRQLDLPKGVKLLQDGELIAATVREVLEVVEAPAEGTTAEPEVIGKKVEEGEAGAEAGAKGAAAGGKAAPAKGGDAKAEKK